MDTLLTIGDPVGRTDEEESLQQELPEMAGLGHPVRDEPKGDGIIQLPQDHLGVELVPERGKHQMGHPRVKGGADTTGPSSESSEA